MAFGSHEHGLQHNASFFARFASYFPGGSFLWIFEYSESSVRYHTFRFTKIEIVAHQRYNLESRMSYCALQAVPGTRTKPVCDR